MFVIDIIDIKKVSDNFVNSMLNTVIRILIALKFYNDILFNIPLYFKIYIFKNFIQNKPYKNIKKSLQRNMPKGIYIFNYRL